MTMSHRVVDIIVPNRTSRKAAVTLRITRTDPAQLEGLKLEGGQMEVGRFGLTEDMCSDVSRILLLQELTIQLDPYQDVVVRAVVEIREPTKGRSAVAAFYVTDTRTGGVTGGVTVVCTSPAYPTRLPSAPDPMNLCPLFLATDLFCVDPAIDPGFAGGVPGLIETSRPQDLVALVENSGPKDLTNTTLYLEHTDNSGVNFVPRVWHIGNVNPGGRFWATWAVDARGAQPGKYEATFVAQSDQYEPIRLRAGFRIRARNW